MTDPAAPAPKKRTKKVSPVQRSLAEMKGRGWTAAVTEHWNPHAFIRQDLFGIFDLVALDGVSILGVQVKGGESVAPAQEKIGASAAALLWLAAGGKIQIWKWRKVNERQAGRRKLWALLVVEAELAGGVIAWNEVEEVEA